MIISKTPYRISFFGGGTDYPAWYEKNGGCVLGAGISRYCYISCRYLPPFFDYKYRIAYSVVEHANIPVEIKHPAVRECLRFLNIDGGLEIHHDGDLPKQTGLGTSSSFMVGLLHALHALRGEMTTPIQLATEAIHIERDLCGDNVGSQDQVLAAYGGLNHVKFLQNGSIVVSPVTVAQSRLSDLQDHLMLFFTGFARYSSEVAAEQVKNVPRKQAELSELQKMVAEGIRVLGGNAGLRPFGELLHEAWRLKRSLSSRISNEAIDAMYDAARRAGAVGGKLCGAGGGGFLLLFAAPDRHGAIREALGNLLCVPFRFDWLGSQIVVYQPDPTETSWRG